MGTGDLRGAGGGRDLFPRAGSSADAPPGGADGGGSAQSAPLVAGATDGLYREARGDDHGADEGRAGELPLNPPAVRRRRAWGCVTMPQAALPSISARFGAKFAP